MREWFTVLYRTVTAYLRTLLRRYVRPRRYDQIFNCIDRLKARNLMEIGTYRAVRGISMIETAKVHHSPSSIHYFGFDLFERMDNKQFEHEISKQPLLVDETREKLEATGAGVTLVKGNTLETLPANVASLPKMDVIFIDGGHSYQTILNDWTHSKQLMHESTVVIFDDYWLNRLDGAKPVVDAIDRRKYQVELLPEIDVFFNPNFGRLVIKLAQVTQRKN